MFGEQCKVLSEIQSYILFISLAYASFEDLIFIIHQCNFSHVMFHHAISNSYCLQYSNCLPLRKNNPKTYSNCWYRMSRWKCPWFIIHCVSLQFANEYFFIAQWLVSKACMLICLAGAGQSCSLVTDCGYQSYEHVLHSYQCSFCSMFSSQYKQNKMTQGILKRGN